MDIVFQFSSLGELFWMDGHGPYVWASYAIAGVAIVGLVIAPSLRRRRFFRIQRAIAQRENTQ